MAHQPSSILLVKTKKEEAKVIRAQLRSEKLIRNNLVANITALNRAIMKQNKAIEQLTARHDEVKAKRPPRIKIAIATAGLGGD